MLKNVAAYHYYAVNARNSLMEEMYCGLWLFSALHLLGAYFLDGLFGLLISALEYVHVQNVSY